MRFLNREQILANAAEGLQDARSDALAILERGVDAVEPAMLVSRSLQLKDKALTIRGDPFASGPGSTEDVALSLEGVEAIRCVAAGKGAEAMLCGLEAVLQPSEGFAVGPHPEGGLRLPSLAAGHPLPDERSCEAGHRALELARATGERDLLIVLLSGGASALMEEPTIPLEDLRALTQSMLQAGARIEELNAVRTKLSAIKGGKLASAAKGRVLALILSDVAEGHESLVGSGPTAADATTWGDALAILEGLQLLKGTPASAADALREGQRGKRGEGPKPGDPGLRRTTNVVIGSGALAAHEATQLAAELGYNAFRVREPLHGSAQRAGWKIARMAEDISFGKAALPRPACIVYAGETTVDARGSAAKGGRNQEACLAAMEALKVEATIAFLGTDGKDGRTGAAGAMGDMGSKERAQALGLDFRGFLQRHASGEFFEQLGDALLTAPTGTNVADLAVLIVP